MVLSSKNKKNCNNRRPSNSPLSIPGLGIITPGSNLLYMCVKNGMECARKLNG